jgi:hypothetical protein
MVTKKTKPKGRMKNIFVLRGSDEFREWMSSLADTNYQTVTAMVRQSMILYAKHIGHVLPPRRF